MLKKNFVVKNKYGIHARPARLIVETASKFASDIMLSKNDEEVNGKSIMGILQLEARCNTNILVTINGKDENNAMVAIEKAFQTIETIDEFE